MSSLVACTHEKISKYKEVLNSEQQRFGFWDVIVVTARDKSQKETYSYQINLKKKRHEIPSYVKYIVISDPPGVKVGSGGSTLHCLNHLFNTFGDENLNKWKVLIIHAGGFSQRLPNESVLGKVFLTFPSSTFPLQMFDALLMMYIDIPEQMDSGVFVAASDVIFLYNSRGVWNFKTSGFTAITHPASIKLAKNHGVFVLEDMVSPWEKYKAEPSLPAMVSTPKCYMHKQSIEVLRDKGALIADTDLVYIDLAYYFDITTARKLLKLYLDLQPLKCEIDAYADFLQPLGSAAISNCFIRDTSEKARVKEALFPVLKGTPINVVIFHEAQFNHVGTISEFLYHIFQNAILKEAYQFTLHPVSNDVEDSSCKPDKEVGHCSNKEYALVNSCIKDRLFVKESSLIEYCIAERAVTVGRNSLLSNLEIPEDAVIPSNVFMHTLVIKMQDKVFYVTSVFGVNDDIKRTLPRNHALDLVFLNMPLVSLFKTARDSALDLWTKEEHCNLWSAKLFPACSSRMESCNAALSLIAAVQQLQLASFLKKQSKLLSMEDMMVLKSTTAMLEFQSKLLE